MNVILPYANIYIMYLWIINIIYVQTKCTIIVRGKNNSSTSTVLAIACNVAVTCTGNHPSFLPHAWMMLGHSVRLKWLGLPTSLVQSFNFDST